MSNRARAKLYSTRKAERRAGVKHTDRLEGDGRWGMPKRYSKCPKLVQVPKSKRER
jgi:hypothetical protein